MPSEQDKALAEQARKLSHLAASALEEMYGYIENIKDKFLKEQIEKECENNIDFL